MSFGPKLPQAGRLLCLLLAFSSRLCFPAVNQLTWGWKSDGLISLRYRGSEFLSRGQFMVNAVAFKDATGKDLPGAIHSRTNQDLSRHVEVLTFDWGVVNVVYQLKSSELDLRIGVMNGSPYKLTNLSLDALALQLPSTPRQYDGKQPMLGTNIGEPTLLPLDYRGGSIIAVNEDVRRPLLLGMPWSLNQPARTIFPVRINIGRDPMYPNSLPFIDRPILPGNHDEYDISLRFSNTSSDLLTSAKDVLRTFAGLNEYDLHWPDRRPIGSLILATAATNWSTNPRGWLLDPKINIETPAGIEEFHARIIAWAEHSIAILKKMNAQGMITWDIEGEQFAHPVTYVGDPSASDKTAPEMTAITDDYFKRFTRAGLRVGVTVRPQKFEMGATGARQVDVPDPAAELIRKIGFAKRHWGATLFYIDSNGDAVNPLSADVMSKLAKAFPDVLLIPEHKNVAYYAKCAPYSESRGGHYSTPGLAAAIYPRAFSVINTADSDVDKHYADLLAAVNRGDILMFRSWFDDPANSSIKAIYAQSNFRGR